MAHAQGQRKQLKPIILGVAVILAASLVSCNFAKAMDAEYSDSTLNWISNFDFGVSRTDTSSGWALAYKDEVGSSSYAYMSLDATGDTVSDTSISGLSSSAAVYRLSVNNLIGNSDFESDAEGAVSPNGWGTDRYNVSNTIPTTEVYGSANSAAVNGKGFYFNQYPDTKVYFNLADASAGLLDSPADNQAYHLNFNERQIKSDTILYLNYYAPTDLPANIWETNRMINLSGVANTVNALKFDVMYKANLRLGFGAQELSQEGVIDDFRAVRSDIHLYAELGLKVTDPGIASGLIPGRYSFSVWVKNDPSAYSLSSGSAKNPYQAEAVTLSIMANTSDSTSTGGVVTVFNRDDWSNWTKLTVEIPADDTLQFTETSAATVFYLRVSPTDLQGNLDAGSLLVAQPELNFLLN
jgi:hypothetical protein